VAGFVFVLAAVAYQFYQATMQEKRAGDIVLPGKGWQWVVSTLIFLIAIIVIAIQSADDKNVVVRGQPGFEQARARAVEAQAQKETDAAVSNAVDQFMQVTPDKTQSSVQAMADFMVKDGNITGLRMWAQSLGVSSPDFASALTLREEIRRASNDFSIYRDKKEVLRLIELLGGFSSDGD